jgi:zinc and cadmium transporter
MLLMAIVLGTVLAGVGSVWVAALLSFGALARYTAHMLSLAAGALLATAFMHLLPEAFESSFSAHALFTALLIGLVFFFLLDKAELWHHGHEHAPSMPSLDQAMRTEVTAQALDSAAAGHAAHAHDHGGHSHAHGSRAHGHAHGAHGHSHAHSHGGGAWSVLTGDGVHCFGDGVLIASAFMADLRLGAMAAVAVLAHEVPHHMGDLAVLTQGRRDRRTALLKVSLAGGMTALGGVVGYLLVDQLSQWLPIFLVLASSSFIYVALADLIPQLQKRLSLRETAAQLLWLALGIALVTLASRSLHHEHGHGDDHDHDHPAHEAGDHKH